jgi:hypothetical protein
MSIVKTFNRRSKFAYHRGMHYFQKMKDCEKPGNVMGCAYIDKLTQARRIYLHYNNEVLKYVENVQRTGNA